MKLYIDTSSRAKTVVGLDDRTMEQDSSGWHSQMVLPMIEKTLELEGKELKDVTEIEVNLGPGSFTGLRVGVAVANTLGFALGVPVNGKKVTALEIVEPKYDLL